ncbi:MAG: hypothetical protein GY847_30085 [Proteobacteria bacterium]|nr:hypothetical protein [Pseudomonadota bacterium]
MKYGFLSRVKSICICLLFLVLAIGCGKKSGHKESDDKTETRTAKASEQLPDGLTPEQAAKVVAKVGDQTITVGDVTRHINRLSPYIRRRWAAPEKRRELLEKLVRVELLSQEAKRLGLTDEPEVQRTVKQVMIRLMIKNDLEKNLFPSKIEEKVLKEEYEKESNKYHRPSQARASHIMLKTRGEAEKLLADLKNHSTDSRYFRQKAREFSIDDGSKDRGGDLGYFSKPAERRDDEPEVPIPVAEAVWKLKNVGDISNETVETKEGFHIVKLTNKRAEMNRSFESVKRMIENRLLREKRKQTMDKFIADLRTKAKVEIFKENLAKLKIDSNGVVAPHAHHGAMPPKKPSLKPISKGNGKNTPKPLAKAGAEK